MLKCWHAIFVVLCFIENWVHIFVIFHGRHFWWFTYYPKVILVVWSIAKLTWVQAARMRHSPTCAGLSWQAWQTGHQHLRFCEVNVWYDGWSMKGNVLDNRLCSKTSRKYVVRKWKWETSKSIFARIWVEAAHSEACWLEHLSFITNKTTHIPSKIRSPFTEVSWDAIAQSADALFVTWTTC